jgi:hypothetical protein
MSTSLVPLPAEPSELDACADAGKSVELALERAKEWLAQALDKGDIDGIVELKSQAEAIRTYTAQKQLGKDAELAAAEIVRRAERGIGVAIRKGQEAERIRRRGQKSETYNRWNGNRVHGRDHELQAPTDFLPPDELARGVYPVVDGVSDDEFEEAIEEAKEEGNLSRANVVRKVRTSKRSEGAKTKAEETSSSWQRVKKAREMAEAGYTSRQIGQALGIKDMANFRARHRLEVPADAVVGKTRHIDSNRIVSEIVLSLEASRMSLDLVEMDQLDQSQVEHWTTSLSTSIRSLNRLHKQLKEMVHD